MDHPAEPRPQDVRPDLPPQDPAEPAGDPVCWLERVCDACGALGDGPPGPVCERCGAPLDPS